MLHRHRTVITGRMTHHCVMRFWRKNCCQWSAITAISKSLAALTKPCGVNTNICNQLLITLRCNIFATRMIFTRYSANCFINKVRPAIVNHLNKSARGYLLWLIFYGCCFFILSIFIRLSFLFSLYRAAGNVIELMTLRTEEAKHFQETTTIFARA